MLLPLLRPWPLPEEPLFDEPVVERLDEPCLLLAPERDSDDEPAPVVERTLPRTVTSPPDLLRTVVRLDSPLIAMPGRRVLTIVVRLSGLELREPRS